MLESWKEEKRSAWLYRVLSDLESGTPRQLLFLELARDADDQSELWAQQALKAGLSLPANYQPDLRVRMAVWLARRFGPSQIKLILAAMKVRGLSVYSGRHPGSHAMPTNVEEIGARHRWAGTSGGLRAAVFGVNDGLIFIALLVMGVAGASSKSSTILLTGIAGLLAGAFSMAAGEYISMRSQREVFEYHQIGLERDELAQYPQEEAEELALIYQARGMAEDEAHAFARRMIANPEMDLDVLAPEELGFNPDQLGSPWQAAIFSFFAFISGGTIPMLPFVLEVQRYPLLISIMLSCIALFIVGALLSLFTGRQALWGGLRALGIGAVVGAVTYWIGGVLGAKIG